MSLMAKQNIRLVITVAAMTTIKWISCWSNLNGANVKDNHYPPKICRLIFSDLIFASFIPFFSAENELM